MGKGLKKIVFAELAKQRKYLLAKEIKKRFWADAQDYAKCMEIIVFIKKNILEQAFERLDMDRDDMEPDEYREYREYQHETVQMCVDRFNQCEEESRKMINNNLPYRLPFTLEELKAIEKYLIFELKDANEEIDRIEKLPKELIDSEASLYERLEKDAYACEEVLAHMLDEVKRSIRLKSTICSPD